MSRPPAPPAGRRALLRWLGWFTAANAGLAALVGLRYLWIYPFPAEPPGIAYTLLTWAGHFSLLATVAVLLPTALLVVLWPRWGLVRPLAALLAALLLALLVLDSSVFVQYRFHLGLLTAALFERSTWIGFALQVLIFTGFQLLLGGVIHGWLAPRPRPVGGRPLFALLAACWLGSQGLHIWGDAIGYTPITQFSRYLPAYYPIHAKRRLARMGLVDPALAQERRMLRGSSGDGQLNYPLVPLACSDEPAPNLLFVLVDALRPDAVDPRLTPNLAATARESQVFNDHWSGGNSSRMGLFSIFYGLPAPYWQAFNTVQRPPLLMDELTRRGYRAGLFSAVGFGSPTLLDRTVFAGVGQLAPESQSPAVEKNREVTRGWLEWLAAQPAGEPFFGLLYYDPPVGSAPDLAGGGLPLAGRYPEGGRAADLWNDYQRAVAMVDGEIGLVLDDLAARDLLGRTVVVFLSDHGYEFDENGLGHFGHASAFTAEQLRSVLMLRWPGREPAAHQHRTAHQDLAPTLLTELLGCRNDPADYSLGRNLFGTDGDWDWIIAGSYSSWAIVEAGRTTVSYPGGLVEVLGPDYRPAPGLRMDPALVAEAMAALRRYYR